MAQILRSSGRTRAGILIYRLAGVAEGVPVVSSWNFITVDPAASEKETADHTAIAVFAVTPNRDLLVLEVIRKRLAIDAIVPAIAEACRRWKPHWGGH